MKRAVIVILWFTVAAVASAQVSKEELLAAPQYAEKDLRPAYKAVTVEDLEKGIKVVSGRNNALFGFNTPEVQIHMPRVDNNVLAMIEFSDAKLYDAKGNEVPYEREDGFYTHEDFESETRFAKEDGVVKFARAVGGISIRYPAVIRTTSMKVSETKKLAEAGLEVDGPFVKTWERSGIGEDAFGTPFDAVRAWDAKGGRLEKVSGYFSSGYEDDQSYTGRAFHGEPAKLEFDVVEKWIAVDVQYDLPPAPPIPEAEAGTPIEVPAVIVETPGGRITIVAKEMLPPSVLGPAAMMSRDEILERLAMYDIDEISNEELSRQAIRGDVEAVRLLLAGGASPNVVDANGWTPLIGAAANRQDDIAILLIDAGADVNAHDSNDSTALIWAAQRCDATDLVKRLIKAGADVNARAKGSATPMMMATVMKCTDSIKALEAAGAKEWKPGE